MTTSRLPPNLYDFIAKTPLVFSYPLSALAKKRVWLKLETQQPTNSFKVRPAFVGILNHLDQCRREGVLATSSGNFAQGVAYAAALLGVKATIVITDDTSSYKVERTKKLGGEVVFCGNTFESRFETVERLRRERGGHVLHGFDSEDTILGNATIGFELIEQLRGQGPFSVISPASGGGLISGISWALKEKSLDCKVFGAQPAAGGAIVESLKAGRRVNIGKVKTIADALVASMPGERTFEYIQKYVDGFTSVSESQITEAVQVLAAEQKLIVEPGGAVSVAALLAGNVATPHPDVVCILSGGNATV